MIVIESGFAGTLFDLTTPRMAAGGYTGTVTTSSEAEGYWGPNALTGETYKAWRPTSLPATWTLAFAGATVAYVGIAAHDLGTQGCTVEVQRWTGSAWSTVASHTPADNSPILFLLTERAAQTTFRVSISGGSVPTIGVIWIGNLLEFPQKGLFRDSVPFNEASASSFATNLSDGGHTLGRYERRRQSNCSMTVNNISEQWAADNWFTIADWLRRGPVFLADRPAAYPKSVVFGETEAPFVAPRAGRVLGAARSMTIELKGYDPV